VPSARKIHGIHQQTSSHARNKCTEAKIRGYFILESHYLSTSRHKAFFGPENSPEEDFAISADCWSNDESMETLISLTAAPQSAQIGASSCHLCQPRSTELEVASKTSFRSKKAEFR
jgi:hypothetical protein